MIGLLQRVSSARVDIGAETAAAIGPGMLVLVAVERGDGSPEANRLAERILNYRIFEDREGRMNLALRETGGGLLLVPQFTLAADTSKGNRPGFSAAASPEDGRYWFEYLVQLASGLYPRGVESGHFGADMQVSLVNDGPVTFWLRVPPNSGSR